MSHDVQQILQSYMVLYSQQKWDDWIALWADDGVLEFPFAPAGRRARYEGKADILAYMQATAARMSGHIRTEGMTHFRVRPLAEEGACLLEMGVKGQVVATGAPYQQTYISVIEAKDGKLTLYREYWNPLASMDANGGREAWTAAFGMPEGDAA